MLSTELGEHNEPQEHDSLIKSSNEENLGKEHILAQHYRSYSKFKWIICLTMSFSWMSAYFCAFGPSYLESSLMTCFNWSASEYSYIVSSTFIAAIFSPIFIPYLLRNFSAFMTLIIFQLPIIVGQLIFIMVILMPDIQSNLLWILMYISRILIGVGIGGCDSLIISVLIFWFGHGDNTGVASCILIIGIESGIIIGRYSMSPLADIVGLGYAYTLGVILTVFAIILLYITYKLERKWLSKQNTPEYVVKHSRMITESNEKSSTGTWQLFWTAVKSFKIEVWLVIIIYSFLSGVIDTMYATLTSPLMYMYNVSEYTSDQLWSMTSIAIVSTSLFSGILMDKVGCIVQFSVLSSFLFLIGFVLFLCGEGVWVYAVISVSVISCGIIFAPAIFSLKALVAPVEYASFVASIATSFHWINSWLFSDAVGWMKDEYGSYSYSILFIIIVVAIQLVTGLLMYLVSVVKGLPFHQSRGCATGNNITTLNDESFEIS